MRTFANSWAGSSPRSQSSSTFLRSAWARQPGSVPNCRAVSKPTSAITSSPEKLAAAARAKARGSNDVADYPNPDLAIEVDISPSLVDRPGIYAFLGVAEVWRFDGQTLTIERLDPGGRYLPIETSAWLPIKDSEVVRWLTQEDTTDESAWARRLRNWVRAELAVRRASC